MRTNLSETLRSIPSRIKNFFNAYFKGEIKIRLWVKIIVFLGLLFLSLIAGLMFGYGVLGDGDKLDALKPSTWTHILDFMRK